MSHIDSSGAWRNPGDEIIRSWEWIKQEALQRLPLDEPAYVVIGNRSNPRVDVIKIHRDFSCIPAQDSFHWPGGLATALESLIRLYNSAKHIKKAQEEDMWNVVPRIKEHLNPRFRRLINREGASAVAESLHKVIKEFEAGTYCIEDRTKESRPFG